MEFLQTAVRTRVPLGEPISSSDFTSRLPDHSPLRIRPRQSLTNIPLSANSLQAAPSPRFSTQKSTSAFSRAVSLPFRRFSPAAWRGLESS